MVNPVKPNGAALAVDVIEEAIMALA